MTSINLPRQVANFLRLLASAALAVLCTLIFHSLLGFNAIFYANLLLHSCGNIADIGGPLLVLACLWLLSYRATQSLLTVLLVFVGAAFTFVFASAPACSAVDPIFDRNFFLLLFCISYLTLIFSIFLYCIHHSAQMIGAESAGSYVQTANPTPDKTDTRRFWRWSTGWFMFLHLLFALLMLVVLLMAVPPVLLVMVYVPSAYIFVGIIQAGLAYLYALCHRRIERHMDNIGIDSGTKLVFRGTSLSTSLFLFSASLLFHGDDNTIFKHFAAYDGRYFSNHSILAPTIAADLVLSVWIAALLLWFCVMLMLVLVKHIIAVKKFRKRSASRGF